MWSLPRDRRNGWSEGCSCNNASEGRGDRRGLLGCRRAGRGGRDCLPQIRPHRVVRPHGNPVGGSDQLLTWAEWIVGLAGTGALALSAVFAWLFRRRGGPREARGAVPRAVHPDAPTWPNDRRRGPRLQQCPDGDPIESIRTHFSGETLRKVRKRYLAEMRKAAERAAHMTRELSAFSRGLPKQTGILDLNDFIQNVLMMVRQSLRGDIIVRLNLAQCSLPAVQTSMRPNWIWRY